MAANERREQSAGYMINKSGPYTFVYWFNMKGMNNDISCCTGRIRRPSDHLFIIVQHFIKTCCSFSD